MKHSRFSLLIIFLLTAFAVILLLPKTNPWRLHTPKLPGLGRAIDVTFPLGGSTVGSKEYQFKKGLDIAGGTSVLLQADMSHIKPEQRKDALASSKDVLERRVNLFGVSEPLVQTAIVGDNYRIIVDLPGINVQQAVRLIGTTAQLSFWEAGASGSALQRDPNTLPLGIPQILGVDAKQTDLSGKDLQNAAVVFDPNSGKPQTQLQFTSSGAKKFADITTRNIGKPVAIVLDDAVISYPTVQTAILDGNAVITGQFTTEQANQLAIALRAGALPVPLHIMQQQSIGATLGAASLAKSLFAGILGFGIVIVFMLFLYGRFGFVASLALIVYALIVLALFKFLSVTLTLAGIAGFILSVGMAVDANILIFERAKEERLVGRDMLHSLQLGFSRAWPSIRDSNISTLITCFILYQFGTGIVRGFAFTLAIGVVVSMFSAIIVTRTFLGIFAKLKILGA